MDRSSKGADLLTACFGQAVSEFGKYEKVEKADGSEVIVAELLDMAKDICDKGNFRSMDVDIFETTDGKYYVNELQTIFGSYDPSQMYIDGKPGRYRFINNEWQFEEGYFNQNYSCNLRVEDFIKYLKEERG